MDATASTQPRKDGHDRPGALIKVNLPLSGVAFECGTSVSYILGDVAYHTNEYWVYMVAGEHGAMHLKIKHPDYQTIDVKFSDYDIPMLDEKATYLLSIVPQKISLFRSTRVYAQPEGKFGMMNSIGGSIGGYISNINLELSYQYGIDSSEEIFWNDTNNNIGTVPYSYIYKGAALNIKAGYGIDFGKYFCITPQVGTGVIMLSGNTKQIGDTDPNARKGNAVNLIVGVKFDYLFSKHIGITAGPEYNYAVKKSDLFNRLAEVSPKIKRFGNGLNVRIGIFVTF